MSSTCRLRLTSGSPWHHQQMSSSTRASCYLSTFHHASRWLKSFSRVRLTRASSPRALPQQHHTSRAMHHQQIHVMSVVSSMWSIISTNAHPPVSLLLMQRQPVRRSHGPRSSSSSGISTLASSSRHQKPTSRQYLPQKQGIQMARVVHLLQMSSPVPSSRLRGRTHLARSEATGT